MKNTVHSDSQSIWFRYFFKRHLKLFLGCLFLLFMLFVLTDLMGHIKDILDRRSDKGMWVQYYLALFSIRFDTLVPFSILISSTLLLTSISKKNEMIPLLNAGLALSRQIRPFFSVVILAMIAMWSNAQWFFPAAIRTYDYIKETDFGKEKPSVVTIKKMGTIYLRDSSKLFFQHADFAKKKLFDVFWMPNQNTILHIEELSYLNEASPEGLLIDIVERNSENIASKTETMIKSSLPQIKLTEEDVQMATHPAKHLSIGELLKLTYRMIHSSSEQATETVITLLLKLLNPLTCLLALIVPIPYCLSFQRNKHPVLFLFFFLAALFIFHLTIQTSTILARIPGTPTLLFLALPWALAGFFSGKKLRRFLNQV